MPETETDLLLRQIADEEDIQFLKEAAAELGITVQQLVKEKIEKHIVQRTRPKTMSGTVQPFRRPYSASKPRPDEGLNRE